MFLFLYKESWCDAKMQKYYELFIDNSRIGEVPSWIFCKDVRDMLIYAYMKGCSASELADEEEKLEYQLRDYEDGWYKLNEDGTLGDEGFVLAEEHIQKRNDDVTSLQELNEKHENTVGVDKDEVITKGDAEIDDKPVRNLSSEKQMAEQLMSTQIEETMEVKCLKTRINNLVWKYAPEEIKLCDADKIACHIYNCIEEGRICEK